MKYFHSDCRDMGRGGLLGGCFAMCVCYIFTRSKWCSWWHNSRMRAEPSSSINNCSFSSWIVCLKEHFAHMKLVFFVWLMMTDVICSFFEKDSDNRPGFFKFCSVPCNMYLAFSRKLSSPTIQQNMNIS